MSQETFEQLWKRLLIYAPECPPVLAQEFINTAYSKCLSHMGWTGVRGESAIILPAPYTTGTISATQGSATITGSSTVFASTMVGRQLFTEGQSPYYTIIAVASATSLTLDREWEKASVSGSTYEINLVYPVMPEDFLYFEAVVDTSNNWKMRTDFQQWQIDSMDPQRSDSGTPWVLAAATFSPVVGEENQPRYEIWPRTSGPKTYPFRYMKRINLLSAASDLPIFPIRGDVLRAGALAELSRWPGTGSAPNPYYGETNYRMNHEQYMGGLRQLEREEQSLNQTDIHYDEWEGYPLAPLDARYIQEHI